MMPFQASRTKLCAFKLLLYNAYSVLQVIRLSHYPAAPSLRIQESLPEGFETVLGKWFGGAELSAGEWQRVALARAFLRRAKLIILDEPTSMLDVWAEARWFSRFRDLAKGCTVLIISHRLTTTMQADVIQWSHHRIRKP